MRTYMTPLAAVAAMWGAVPPQESSPGTGPSCFPVGRSCFLSIAGGPAPTAATCCILSWVHQLLVFWPELRSEWTLGLPTPAHTHLQSWRSYLCCLILLWVADRIQQNPDMHLFYWYCMILSTFSLLKHGNYSKYVNWTYISTFKVEQKISFQHIFLCQKDKTYHIFTPIALCFFLSFFTKNITGSRAVNSVVTFL